MEFCDNLRRLRKLRNYTQKGMAQKLGMTNQNYNRYEMQNAQPPLPVLKEIANILGVTLDELAGVNEVDRYIGYLSSYGVYAREQGDYIEIYECEIPWGAEIWGDAPEDSKLPLRIKKDSFLQVMKTVMENIHNSTRPVIVSWLYSLLVLPLERQAHELPKIKK